MSESDTPSAPADEVVVQLLDAALGRAVKTWRFAGCPDITIGRLPECSVEISDSYVSRLHAELQCRDGRWTLFSRGRSGVIVASRQITEIPVEGDVTFQLGTSGPVLRFAEAHEDTACARTLCFDADSMPLFSLDTGKLHHEVKEIADGDYFRNLQSQARTLRAKRRET